MSRWIVIFVVATGLACSAQADSLLRMASAKSETLINEKTARFKVGDLVTVIVLEQINALTKADTKTKKESDVGSEAQASANGFLLDNGFPDSLLPNWAIESENETKNIGQTLRKSSLTTTLGCVVTHVFPNGNLMLEGEKLVAVNRENSRVVVRGLARSRDVTPQNTILSTQIANATITLRGSGPLWNNQRRGLITRMLDWFSPN